MRKPCSTDEFIKALCLCNEHLIDYDFYAIQDAVVLWNHGEYLEALEYIDASELIEILDDRYEVTHDQEGYVHSVKDLNDAL